MSIIKILPDNLINKIAAGEVVNRPFSVIKELIENSVDAKSSEILVKIEKGGKDYIEISDNGKGMNKNDLILAFERHATSKIKNYNDLENIATMGFRGEALPSIAAVGRVQCFSRDNNNSEDEGNVITIDGGKIIVVKPASLTNSTTFIVRKLFFNVPARRKYLKTAKVEYKHIYTYLKKAALAYPEISFKFVSDERVVFDYKSAVMSERIKDVFKEIPKESLLEVNFKSEKYIIKGMVGKKELARKYRDNQFLFVNNRPVENKLINYAIFQAYRGLIETGSYPFYILYFEIPPSEIDINIHPNKLEVKFNDENLIRILVKKGITEVLSGQSSLVSFEFTAESYQTTAKNKKELEEEALEEVPKTTKLPLYKPTPISEDSVLKVEEESKEYKVDKKNKKNEQKKPEELFLRTDKSGVELLKLGREQVVTESVWQLHCKYVILESESGMMIIDQHVAQERIFYEKALIWMSESKNQSQISLFPTRLELSNEDSLVYQEIADHLTNLGYTISHFGGGSYIIEGTPPGIKNGAEIGDFLDILDYYKKYREKKKGIVDSIAASYACKRSIKAGQRLSRAEMLELINQLFLCKFPHVCPHGRPVIINMNISEIDKRFMRTS